MGLVTLSALTASVALLPTVLAALLPTLLATLLTAVLAALLPTLLTALLTALLATVLAALLALIALGPLRALLGALALLTLATETWSTLFAYRRRIPALTTLFGILLTLATGIVLLRS